MALQELQATVRIEIRLFLIDSENANWFSVEAVEEDGNRCALFSTSCYEDAIPRAEILAAGQPILDLILD